jgi:transketolase
MDELGHSIETDPQAGGLCYVPAPVFERLRALALPPGEFAAAFAGLCRINAFYMIARAGSGHIGTTFSALDIMSWLFLHELRRLAEGPDRCDIFFSSKGHDAPGLYAVLIGLGLLDFSLLHRLRRLGGLPGHPDVETPYVQANTGSLGMGISKAKGMALANRLQGTDRRIFVLTGDGEVQEGQIWEALPSAARLGLSEITVIVDHNKVQSDTWIEGTSPLGDLARKFESFGWSVARCDGHDFGALETALAQLRDAGDRPRVLIADTIKGKGVSFMESRALGPEDYYRYHSGAPSDDAYAAGIQELVRTASAALARAGLKDEMALEWIPRPARAQHGAPQRLVAAYSRALVEQAEREPRLVALDADLVLDCGLIPFKERFPGRYIQCGIAEQDMVSQAGGLARSGLLPVVHSFASFLATRPNEQIYNNASEGTKVIYVGSLAGLLPGGPGHSHQSVRDISALGAVPGLVLIEPCTEREVGMAVDYAVREARGSVYLRLVSLGWDVSFTLPADYRLAEGRGVVIREGTDAVLFGAGPWLLSNACDAADRLAHRGLSVRVVDLPWLNRVDPEWLRRTVAGCRWMFTLDNHYVDGGQGQMLLTALAELGLGGIRARRIGVTELPVCGGNTEVLRAHRLDADALAATIAALAGAGP